MYIHSVGANVIESIPSRLSESARGSSFSAYVSVAVSHPRRCSFGAVKENWSRDLSRIHTKEPSICAIVRNAPSTTHCRRSTNNLLAIFPVFWHNKSCPAVVGTDSSSKRRSGVHGTCPVWHLNTDLTTKPIFTFVPIYQVPVD